MEYFTTTSAASRRASGCIIIGVYQRGKLGIAATDVDTASGGTITRLIKLGDISARPGSCTVLTSIAGVRAQRIAVVGLGKVSKFGVTQYRRAIACAIAAIKDSKAEDVVNYLALESVADSSAYYLARYAVETIGNTLYSFTEMKSGRKKSASKLRKIGQARSEEHTSELQSH